MEEVLMDLLRLVNYRGLMESQGGAGRKSDSVMAVMKILVHFGAPENMLVDGKPHLGTDRLIPLLLNFLKHLQDLGVTIKFGTRVDDLLVGLRVEHPQELINNIQLELVNFSTPPNDENYGVLIDGIIDIHMEQLKVLIPARRLNGQSNT
ncbi:hypothetical protein C5167_027542 [Papaver somniferum]|nr:hypothetical protein C5167_027542 [Papaver somniferum]